MRVAAVKHLEIIGICALSLGVALPATGEDMIFASATSVEVPDPHLTYDTLGYNLVSLVCRRLLEVSHDGEIHFDLATEEAILNDGAVLRYRLRSDAQFTDGSPVTAADLSYSLHRALSPELASPGAVFFMAISGAAAFHRGDANTVSGIKVLSDHEIEFTLDYPSEGIRYGFATNFGCLLRDMGEGYLGGPLVTAGPFKMVEDPPDGGLLLVSSPEVERDWLVNVSNIRLIAGVERFQALAGLVEGQYDALVDDVTTRSRSDFMADMVDAGEFFDNEPLGTTYLALNTQLPPFDDVRVRKAVNFAMERQRIARLMSPDNQASSQILPSGFPAHVEGRDIYPYDLERARSLMEEAGYTSPISVELLAIESEVNRALAARIASDLRDIGINATIALGPEDTVLRLAADPDRGHIVLSEGLGWVGDFPYSSSFYFPLNATDSLGPNSWNWSQYADPITDQMARDADSLVGNENAAARIEAWRAVFARLEDSAHWVPLYHRSMRPVTSLQFGKTSVWEGERIPYSALPFFSPILTPDASLN